VNLSTDFAPTLYGATINDSYILIALRSFCNSFSITFRRLKYGGGPALIGGIGVGAAPRREPFGQIVQNAANAAFVQPGPRRDLIQEQPLSFEVEDFAMGRRAQGQHLLPKLRRARRLARSRLSSRNRAVPGGAGQRLFVFKREPMMSHLIQEAVARDLDQKGAEVGGVGEMPGTRTKSAYHIGPHGLDDVDRIELRAQLRRHLPANDHAQEWFITQEDLLGRGLISTLQFFQERFKGWRHGNWLTAPKEIPSVRVDWPLVTET
jgi:hypothetical protein